MLFGSPEQREQLKVAEKLEDTVKICLEQIILKQFDAEKIIQEATSILKQMVQILENATLEEIREQGEKA